MPVMRVAITGGGDDTMVVDDRTVDDDACKVVSVMAVVVSMG